MRQTPSRFRSAAAACGALCVLLFWPRSVSAQEYYGVPIEDGGVAFLLDTSGSMENRGEMIKAAAESILRGLAGAVKGTSVEKSGIGQILINQAAKTTTAPKITKMETARHELMRALDSLRDGTNFTIITFGDQAAEWPGGVRAAGPSARSLAQQYVASVYAAGGTPMAEALQFGFQSPHVRTLFVVTDGRPTTGEVLQLVKQLQESREGRRMVINTIGIGTDQDGGLLCQLALDNEGVYVRDGAVACTFSPCAADDGLVTFYPPSSRQKNPNITRVCSSAEHPDCTPELVYDTMLSEARFQTPTRDRTRVTNCLDVQTPNPVTIVINDDGLEATNYTRPGNPLHPGKVTRIVKKQGDDVVIETTGAGNLRRNDFGPVDQGLIAAVQGKLEPRKPLGQQTPMGGVSPCSSGDGIVTVYPPAPTQRDPIVTRVCSSAEHPDCTPKLVYDTMLSEVRFQAPTPERTKVTNCLNVEDPDPVTIVTNDDSLEATDYTRPGNPLHPGKVTRVVKQEGDDVVVETTGAGRFRPDDFEPVDQDLIAAVLARLEPQKPEDAFEKWKKDPTIWKKNHQ
jgi:Mg-chelatase subunit ChlD